MRYPLIDWHGNNGNIAGDEPAHMRYTEARLSKIAEDGMLLNIKKKNVDFIPNYDETCEEPVTLPALFPNLLCNPNSGIGVSISCNWLPHNLNEVAQAIYDRIDGKEPSLPGPDFPTGGIVINKDEIPEIMRTGHGSVKVRGRYKIEKNNIVFYEIPYGLSIESILENICDVCNKQEIIGIAEIRDESNKNGIRIVIECHKNVEPEAIVSQLFNKTNLQTSISYNQVALINKTPMQLSLNDCLDIYINHNTDCIVKEASFNLHKATERQHIVDGLLKALEDIDNIIALIKSSKNAATAKQNLIAKYDFTEAQATAILDMKLSKLANLEQVELQQENEKLTATIKDANELIQNYQYQLQTLKTRLAELVAKYGDARRTQLEQLNISKEEKKTRVIIPEDVVVTISQNSNIQRITAKSFKMQHKGGKGMKNIDEATIHTCGTNTQDTLVLFTSLGRMYEILVDDIPTNKVNLNTLIQIEPDEKIIAVTSLYYESKAQYVIFVTKQGLLKKTRLNEYLQTRKTKKGIAAIKLREGDSLANVTFINEEDMILVTKKGMVIHFPTTDINPIGRMTMGVCAIKLTEGDEVISGLPLHKNTDYLAIVTTNGYGKKMKLSEFVPQRRGGKGLTGYKINETTGEIAGAAMVDDTDTILLIGLPNSLHFSASDIPLLGRISAGNILIRNKIDFIIKI